MDNRFEKILIRFLSFYTMGTIFLPIVFLNIPEPFGRTFFIGPIWIISIMIFRHKLILSRYLNVFYLFFFILYFGSFFIWQNRIIGIDQNLDFKWIFTDLFGSFLSIIMYIYFINSKDFKGLAYVVVVSLIFIFITSITSILGLYLYPGAVRQMASPDTSNESIYLMQQGIAHYGYFGSLIFIFPVLTFYLKTKIISFNLRILIYLFITTTIYSLVLSGFTTALFLSIIFFVYSSFLGNKRNNIFIIILLVVGLFYILFNSYISEIFNEISKLTASEELKFRINDIGRILEFDGNNSNNNQSYFVSNRLTLAIASFEKFLINPLIGGGWGGGHSTWIDRLGFFGIIGFFPWVIIFYQQLKLNSRIFNSRFKEFYYISTISIIVLGCITTTANSYQACASYFFLVPGLYFINYLKS